MLVNETTTLMESRRQRSAMEPLHTAPPPLNPSGGLRPQDGGPLICILHGIWGGGLATMGSSRSGGASVASCRFTGRRRCLSAGPLRELWHRSRGGGNQWSLGWSKVETHDDMSCHVLCLVTFCFEPGRASKLASLGELQPCFVPLSVDKTASSIDRAKGGR